MKWEYFVFALEGTMVEQCAILNGIGDGGWIHYMSFNGRGYARRPVEWAAPAIREATVAPPAFDPTDPSTAPAKPQRRGK